MTITPGILCADCERPLRPYTASSQDRPGTVRHAGHGRCEACYSQARRTGVLEKPNPNSNVLTKRELEYMYKHHPTAFAWHMQRRSRGIPPEGYRIRGDQ